MNIIDKQYKNYIESVGFDSSGKWCKRVEYRISNSSTGIRTLNYPKPYTKKEFIREVKTDILFNERWGGNILRYIKLKKLKKLHE